MKPWDAKGKALLQVEHTTRLEYEEAVVEAHSEVRKTPVNTGLQRVVTQKLDVEPAASLHHYVDYFGSHVHYFNILEPHDFLEIHSTAIVETTDAVCCGPKADDDQRPWRERFAEYLHWSPAVPMMQEYQEIPNPVDASLEPDDFLSALGELGATFKERFRYDETATDVHSGPEVFFEAGGGVCQDLAHAMIGVLRLAAVPCRYISGYVYDPVSEDEGDHLRGAAASHAWVQAWHPELGWVGIDPTNDRLVDWQYIRVAAGRDYTDVQPLRGVFLGPREQYLNVEVSVSRIG
jgi:transglutaminase-like putative cysteine protease